QGQPYDMELQIVDARQQPVWVRAIAKPVLNEEGKVTEIHGAFQDLTSEKAKDQLLSESDQRFHRLADALPVIIWTALPDGTLDFANQALTNYTGVCATELLPAQRWINSIHPDDIDLCIQRWQEAAVSETPYETEFRLRDKNDDMRWHLVSAKP